MPANVLNVAAYTEQKRSDAEPTWDGYEFVGWELTSPTDLDIAGDGTFTMPESDVVFTAQWKKILNTGTSITVKVTMEGEDTDMNGSKLDAADYVTPSNMENNTADFNYTSADYVHTITFSYDKLNCADFYLDVIKESIPSGYKVGSVTSSDEGPTQGEGVDPAELDIHEIVDQPGRWHLDNVPGGATVTVDLVKDPDQWHNVKYSWDGLPENEKLYNEQGVEVTPVLPTDSNEYLEGDEYTVDTTYTDQTVVYTRDQYGNVNGVYTFSGWTDPNNGVMGTEDVTVTGSWTFEGVKVATYNVTYKYDGAVPNNAPALPESATYVLNEPVEIADNPTLDGWTFSGWSITEDFLMPNHDVTITGSWTPNTTDLSVTGYKGVYDAKTHGVTVSGALATDTITYTVNGQSSNNQFVNVTNGTEVLVTVTRDGVAIWSDTATVIITPAPLTITTPSDTKVYDGTALTAGPATIEGLLGNDVATVTATGSQTKVGKSINTYQITWGEDTLSANYTIVETLGVLAVTQASINPSDPNYGGIKVNYPKDVMYAGFDQTWRPTVTTEDGTVLTPGVDYTVSYSKDDRTNVTGDIVVTITGIGNYTGTVTRVYQILPRPVVINVNDAQKIYGTNDPAFSGSVSGVIAPDDLGTVTYFRTNADEAAGVYEDVITAEVSDLNPNYYVQRVNPGTFTIVKADGNAVNVVNADELCKIYDGESVSVIGEAAQPGSTVLYSTDGQNWSTTSPSFTDAGTYTVYVMATHPNFTDAGPITVTVTIWPRPVVLTSATDQKVYDGAALTNDEVTVGGMGFVDSQGATYDVTGSQTEVGSSDNAFTYTLNEGTDEKNYNIATVFGTLTVTAQTIDPSDPDDPSYMGVTISDPEDVIYNSEEQRWEPVVTTADGTVLQAGVDYEVTWSDDVTNVGTVTVTITGVGNFTGTVVKTYQILPAPLTVTTPSAQKVYDGEPLVAGPAELEGVQGDDAIFAEATGSQTEVGSSTNTVKMTWNGLAANYDVTYKLGTLTVLPVPEEPEGNEPGTGTDKPGTGTESGTGAGSEQIPGTGDITSQLPAALGVAGVAAVAIGAYVIKRRKDGTQ